MTAKTKKFSVTKDQLNCIESKMENIFNIERTNYNTYLLRSFKTPILQKTKGKYKAEIVTKDIDNSIELEISYIYPNFYILFFIIMYIFIFIWVGSPFIVLLGFLILNFFLLYADFQRYINSIEGLINECKS